METYEETAKKWQQIRDKNIDLSIISHGFVRLYHKESILDYDIKLLKDKNYEIIEFEGDFLSNKAELHYDLQHKLNFPDYYGKNFDALNDCLCDYEVSDEGTLIVFRHLNHLDKWSITMLLDVFAKQGRQKFAHRKKLLLLVQIDDRSFKITEPIGAINLYLLNDKER